MRLRDAEVGREALHDHLRRHAEDDAKREQASTEAHHRVANESRWSTRLARQVMPALQGIDADERREEMQGHARPVPRPEGVEGLREFFHRRLGAEHLTTADERGADATRERATDKRVVA